ncbi:MAG TPA: NAD(P)/FAD-dependent oxidoreductase [Chloroflexota bacterium]
MSPTADVVVVGGGPAGAATAALLARGDRRVTLLEKARFPREKACAEYLSPGVVDVLERLGARAALDTLELGRPRGMELVSPSGRFLLTYPDGAAERRPLCVARPRFDQALLDHAREGGVRVLEGGRALGAVTTGGRVVGVRTDRGEVAADFVVGADGLHSAIARSLGLERRTGWPRRLGLVARYRGVALNGAAEMHVGRALYCGLAPLGDGTVNVGLVVPLAAGPRDEPKERYFERRLADLPGVRAALRGASRVTPVRGVGPLRRRVHRVDGPGFLLVGDAAGFLDPFTGEGIFRALRGAELAAPAVDRALAQGGGRPTGYAAARRREFAAKEALCWLIQGFLLSPPLFGYALRRLAGRPALAATLARALGDYGPAAPALRPTYLWSLLRP